MTPASPRRSPRSRYPASATVACPGGTHLEVCPSGKSRRSMYSRCSSRVSVLVTPVEGPGPDALALLATDETRPAWAERDLGDGLLGFEGQLQGLFTRGCVPRSHGHVVAACGIHWPFADHATASMTSPWPSSVDSRVPVRKCQISARTSHPGLPSLAPARIVCPPDHANSNIPMFTVLLVAAALVRVGTWRPHSPGPFPTRG